MISSLTKGHGLLYGADYNPDQWIDHPEVLEEDIRLMQRVGATSASVGIFAWTALEPEEGRFDFHWLDTTFDRFAKAGLLIFLATPSGSKPIWMSEKYPEIRRVGRDGLREPSGGRHNHCPSSPIYRERVAKINRELAARYGRHPSLALWHIGNELSGECHCDLCRGAFHGWLKERYKSLDILNQAWWTAFWNHSFTAWEQIPTFDESIDGLTLDWRRFVSEQHESFLDVEMSPLRELTPEIPCTTNYMGTNMTTDYWRWSAKLDLISNDLYPLHDDREESWRVSVNTDFIHSLMRGMADGRPWMLMECSPSSVNWSKVNKLKRPSVHFQETMQAVANGADAIHYFQWRKSRGGYEKYHGAVVDHAGGPGTRVFEECEAVGAELKALEALAGHAPDGSPVALVYDWESRWALEASAGPKAPASGYPFAQDRYSEACLENFQALRTAGIEVDLIPLWGDFSKYSVVVTPALYALSEGDAARLKQFTESGGVWVATYLTGYVDRTNRCWRGGFPGPNLRGVFGIWNEEIDNLFDDERVLAEGGVLGESGKSTVSDILEHLHAEGARCLAKVATDFYSEAPLITENTVGAGLALYVGGRLNEKGLEGFYRDLVTRLGLPFVDLPKGVYSKKRKSTEGTVEFIFNYFRTPVAVDLGTRTFRRPSDGQLCSGQITLAPYETLISQNTTESEGEAFNDATLTPANHE